MSFDDDWGRPADVGGEFVSPKQLAGHLLIAFPIGYIPHIQTRFTQPGKKSDAVCVDIIDLDDKDDSGAPGKVYRNCNWMQAQMIASLRPMIGSKVLGRVGQGVSKNGMNPPWVLNDMSADGPARERANAWKEANPNFRPSVFVPRDEVAPQAQQYSQPAATSYQQGGYPQDDYRGNQSQPQNYQSQPQTYAAPVAGASPLTQEERSVLERMREQQYQRQQQEQQRQASFQERPPF
jgi:hypothetical protein